MNQEKQNDSYQNTLENGQDGNGNDSSEEEELLSQVIEYTAGDIAMMPVSADILEDSKEIDNIDNDIETGNDINDMTNQNKNEAVSLSESRDDIRSQTTKQQQQQQTGDSIERTDTHSHRSERIHSVLALFYFMPIAFTLSLVMYLVCF